MELEKNTDKLEKYSLNKLIKNKTEKESPNNQNGFMDLSNIKSGAYYKTEDKKVPNDMKSNLIIVDKNNVVYGKCRPKLDKAIISKELGYTTTESLVYETDYPYFIVGLFHHKDFINHNINNSTGAKMPRTSNNTVLSYHFYSSKNLNFKKIDLIVKKQVELIELYKEKLSLLKEQEAYYQDELLSGRLRIRLTNESINYATQQGWYLNDDLVEGKEKEFEEWIAVDYHSKVEFYKENEFKDFIFNNRTFKIPKNWIDIRISDVFDVGRGKVMSKDFIAQNKGNYNVYSSATENNGIIGKIDSYMYDGEYLTWTTDGIYAGKIFYRNEKFSATNVCGVLKLKEKKNFNVKVVKQFAQPLFNNSVNKVGNNKLMSNVVSNIVFPIPQKYNEQFLITIYFNFISKLQKTIKEKIKVEEEKMDYLMDELLSGRIRVK